MSVHSYAFGNPLRRDDPTEFARWLHDLRVHIDDALAAGEDATRRGRRRQLSRAYARRLLRQAESAIDALISAAERPAEPTPPPPTPAPSPTDV